jgi:hypothetical protein
MQIPTLHQHVAVQSNITDLSKAISDLVRLRLDPVTAPLVATEEGNLLSCLASLQFLCSDMRAERANDNLSSPDSTLDLIRPVMAEEA